MAAPSSASMSGLGEEGLKNQQNHPLQHSPEGASAAMASFPPAAAASPRRNRNRRGNPSTDAKVVALSPKTLMAKNRFSCEVCSKGFPREQNLQLHRRGHNLPWKLKKTTDREVTEKVYICPEIDCVHHDPTRALGDLSGLKKHFSRKHGEKIFSCDRCDKKYAVYSDLKAHSKICGTKDYKCECGATFSRRVNFIGHRSFCDALAEEVARHTINHSPYSSMASSILANSGNPAPMRQGSAAGSLIQGNHQQLSSPFSVGSAFQPNKAPSMALHPFPGPKLGFPRASDSSGIHGSPTYPAPTNIFNFGFNSGAHEFDNPQNDLDLNMNNSFSGLLMNMETSAYSMLNSTPSPQVSAPALLQKAALTGANTNNVALMRSMGSSAGAMKFDNYGGALGDGMNGAWRGVGSTFHEMYNNLNVGGGSSRGYEGGMEYLSDQMNAPYGGVMYSVKNGDGMLAGPVNNNRQMIVQQSEYGDKLTRDFLGMGNEMNSLTTGSGMQNDHNGYGIGMGTGTDSPDSEATISAEARPFVPRHPGF